MPYTVDNPPEAAKGLPQHAIEIFVAAFNDSWDGTCKDSDNREGCAMAVAWSAVKKSYTQDADGNWHPKEGRMSKLDEVLDPIRKILAPLFEERAVVDVESWDGAASNYDSTDAYCSACLIDVNPSGEAKTQALCKLPVKKPGGTAYVRQALHAAAGAHGLQGVTKPGGVSDTTWAAAKKKAANELITAYKQADEVAPDAIYELAGKSPPTSRTKVRAISLDMLYSQVMQMVYAMQPQTPEAPAEQWISPMGIYREGDELFLVCARGGKLWKQGINIADDDTITFDTPTQVQETFTPVTRLSITRDESGKPRWIATVATAVLNRVGEIDSKALFDSFIDHARKTGEYPVYDVMHYENALRIGVADFVAREGIAYMATGTFDDNEFAQAAARGLEKEPDYWGHSISYLKQGEPEILRVGDVSIPVFTKGINRFISVCPRSRAANLFTDAAVQRGVKNMTDEEKKILAQLVGEEQAARKIAELGDLNRTVAEAGLITREVTPTPAADGKTADGTTTPALATPGAPGAPGAKPTGTPPAPAPATEEKKPEANVVLQTIADQLAALKAEVQASLATTASAMQNVEGAVDALVGRVAKLERTDEEKLRAVLEDQPPAAPGTIVRPKVQRAGDDPTKVDPSETLGKLHAQNPIGRPAA